MEGEPTPEQLQQLRDGVELNDGETLPHKPVLLKNRSSGRAIRPCAFARAFRRRELVIREGRNRQVRRMTAAVGLPTLRLVQYALVTGRLKGLVQGQYKEVPARL